MSYTTRELTTEEGEALTKDIQEVLEKHNAEIGVHAAIQLLKRVETTEPHGENNKEESNTQAEESSTSGSGEPTK